MLPRVVDGQSVDFPIFLQANLAKGVAPIRTRPAHVWLLEVRTFFTDLCIWATVPDSPFGPHAPRVVPLIRRDLVGIRFEKARARTRARITATILDPEREMPTIRACALQHRKAATAALSLVEPLVDTSGGRRSVNRRGRNTRRWALQWSS